MKKNIIHILVGLILLTVGFNACSLDEKYTTEVIPEKYYDSEESVLSAIAYVYADIREYVGNDRWRLQELTADAFCVTTKGPHWYNGAQHGRMLQHKWTADDDMIASTWKDGSGGISRAIDVKGDLEKYVNYPKLGMTDKDKEYHMSLLDVAEAYFYLRSLDFFGGMPISSLKRSTDAETFKFIEDKLLAVLPKLKKKEKLGQSEDGFANQGVVAMMLAQLYFNAEAYIGTPMYDKAKTYAKDIIDGKYGVYDLDPTWSGIHGFENDKSPEMIWTMPAQNAKTQNDWFWSYFYHYESYIYFDSDRSADNGCHLQPSRKPTGEIYTEFKLGTPYENFNDKDLRKKPYVYKGDGNYEGLFLVGIQTNPNTGLSSKGTQEYKGQIINLVDMVAKFAEVGKEGKPATVADLKSGIHEGEENSGIRLVKVPQPNKADKSIRWNPDFPLYRLAEVYYMYAECLLREGNASDAAQWINKVRKRNFEGGLDPDPVTATNLDVDGYRMLKEWQVEFLGEGRRRTDLIRWNKYTTESWWDHKPSDKNKRRFPIPVTAMSGNNSLTQNPGY